MVPGHSSAVVRFGEFEADPANGLLCRKGIRVKLQEQPFRILVLLLERPGQVVTREAIRQTLWPDGTFVDFDGGLNAAMKKLRVALNDASENPAFIETIPKRGYRFIAPVIREASEQVAWVENPPFALAPLERSVAPTLPTRVGTRKSVLRIAVPLGVFIAVLVGFIAYPWHGPRPSIVVNTLAVKPIATRRSVAVLGFYNASAKPEEAWLATALSEMISTELAAGDKLRLTPSEDISNLRLASPWSQTDTLGRATTSRIGTALNSDLLLLGSYTTVGDDVPRQLRVDVRLQDAKSGEILKEVAEIGSGQNLFELVSRIGRRMRDSLAIPNLQAEEQTDVFASMPSNNEAARFYALGLDKFHQFDYLAAAELLEQSVKADPKFPLSHSVLSNVWQNLGYSQKAKAEAKRALDLSANLPQTQKLIISGAYHLSSGKMDEAAADYRSLYAFYPDCIDCGLFLSTAQIQGGHPQEALATLQSLRKLPSPASDDPRIDFNEQWAVSADDRSRQYALLEITAAKASSRGEKLLYARAKLAECANLLFVGRPTEAMATCKDARSVFRALGDRVSLARTLLLEAARESDSGSHEGSLQILQQALEISRALGGAELTASILNGMGNTYERMNRLQEAAGSFREARKKFEESGNRSGISAASDNLGDVLLSLGEFREAEASYQAALRIELDANSAGGCYPLYSIASVRLATGDLQAANARMEAALKACASQKVARHNGFAIGVLGDILRAQDRLPEAQQKYQQALEIYTKADAQDLIPGIQMNLASVLLDEGQPGKAEAILQDLASTLEQRKDSAGASTAFMLLSRSLHMRGKLDEARKSLLRAEQLSHGVVDWGLTTNLSVLNARLIVATNISGRKDKRSFGTARARLQASIAFMRKIGDYDLECEARLALGELELEANPPLGRSELVALTKETNERGFKLVSRKASELLK